MLAPVFILGVMGCDKTDEYEKTDEKIQTEWKHELDKLTLHIDANTMVVKNNGVSTAYETYFSYIGGQDRRIVGDMTMFSYHDRVKLAVFNVVYDGTADPITLTISNTRWINGTLKSSFFPFEGTYVRIYIPLTAPYKAMFRWSEEDEKIVSTVSGLQPTFTVSYKGIGSTKYGPSARPPAVSGSFMATIDVKITVKDGIGYASGGPFEIEFTRELKTIEFEEPEFTLYGGLGSGTGNSADFKMDQPYPAAMLYLFPAEVIGGPYTDFIVYYTVEKILDSGEPDNDIKLAFKNSEDTDMSHDVNVAYPSHDSNGAYTYTGALSAYSKNGLSIHHNRDDSADFKITITMIEFHYD